MTKRILLYSTLALALFAFSLAGCPKPGSEIQSPPKSTDAPEPKGETTPKKEGKPVSPQEFASPETRKFAERIGTLGGKCDWTPSGTIKAITIDTASLEEADVDQIVAQADLETLRVMNYRDFNDATVAKLSGMKKLKRLAITNATITDEAVKTIAGSFPDLTELDLSSNTLLKDSSLKEIAKLTKLERLTLVQCAFREFGMQSIEAMPNLKYLDIRANMTIGNGGMGFVAKIPSLKGFQHRTRAVDDYGLELLTAAKGLESLLIQDFAITDSAGPLLKQFPDLKSLIIFRCSGFGSFGLLELKGMPLERLTVRDMPMIDDTGMEVFRDLPTLKRLYLTELPSVFDAGMMNLVYLKNLELLDIREVPITDASLETIGKLTNLKDLSLCVTDVTDAVVEPLLAMPKLERLTLKDNANVTDAAYKKLRDSGKFKHLDVGVSDNPGE